ncbi:SRPBCC family protein [Paracoccus sp. 1_MG-2023]|uniref:SRPBCC family protein n=1 Tax=unclassified Paracoccus (in: a-proteobacteria) TaxID=2688777 RepID=UPI001C08C254|nr:MULTISPECIES: SRPBCC family protein [unclassified Paracoccus (in: a-proteobacteria)]MBU2958742.1 SRPBCC family protein [Paracoccus sp. C2R09]MDO6667735.1 SRPBCC family protein [Paracoccus sp. 1_MG-2023]
MIEIERLVRAPMPVVWHCWTSAEHIKQWNAASDDWHTTSASVDLQPGGRFLSRMEAKDGSMGFDFAGRYTDIQPHAVIGATLDDGRQARVEFTPMPDGVLVRESFEPDPSHSEEMQRAGWQAILDRFARHAEAQKT